jgi:arginyl-tRNA synthetase
MIENKITTQVIVGIRELFNAEVPEKMIQLQKTRKDFEGDLTLVVFPLLRYSKISPEQTGEHLGNFLVDKLEELEKFDVIKGFLNLTISPNYWLREFNTIASTKKYGIKPPEADAETIMVEYSSPNTNKPLHLGHIRNILLGWSVNKIIEANGKKSIKTNIVNDRGIHICKSMLAWQKWGNNETPESSGIKGDHLVGKYYVIFDTEYKKEIAVLKGKGYSDDQAVKEATVLKEAQELLRRWEAGDPQTIELWKTMNHWVYEGFDKTYKKLGVDFDKIYYESDTFLVGKETVLKGLRDSIFYQRDDSSVWADLRNEGLDEKILLRSDGTSVYMTQDVGTAQLRHKDYNFNRLVYVVGNEQEYHFKVLAIILDKLGFAWAKNLYHLSYGMVELPEGKMKSREGTVVDADDLINEMIDTAREMSKELGKLDDYSEEEKEDIYRMIGLGALKYFILKVDPKKNMTFNPQESIDFNGNTGPFIQYTYTRILSVLRKARENNISFGLQASEQTMVNAKEVELVKLMYAFPQTIQDAFEAYNPSIIANYMYELVKEFNQFYHDYPIIKEKDEDIRNFRLILSKKISEIIKDGMNLLGIEVPKRM